MYPENNCSAMPSEQLTLIYRMSSLHRHESVGLRLEPIYEGLKTVDKGQVPNSVEGPCVIPNFRGMQPSGRRSRSGY